MEKQRDSLGMLTLPAESSPSLSGSAAPTLFDPPVRRPRTVKEYWSQPRVTAAELAAQIGRLMHHFPGERSEATGKVILRDWVKAFGRYSARDVEAAVDAAILKVKFFPKVAEIKAELDLVVRAAVQGLKYEEIRREDEVPEPTPEQRERVAALVAAWRKQFAARDVAVAEKEWTVPSVSDLSPELRAKCGKTKWEW